MAPDNHDDFDDDNELENTQLDFDDDFDDVEYLDDEDLKHIWGVDFDDPDLNQYDIPGDRD